MGADTTEQGAYGERIAEQYLVACGYVCVSRNWRCPAGEIDLIMVPRHQGRPWNRSGPKLRVFVEVRLRQPTKYGEAVDTVSYQKQQKIVRAAKFYQQRENYWDDIRFDVIAITFLAEKTEPAIEHIIDAF